MRIIDFLQETSNNKLAAHYTSVLNSRYVPYGIPLTITTHFVDQIQNPRNQEPISMSEVADFFSKLLLKRHTFLKNLSDGQSIVVVDLESDITVPLVKINDKLIFKTIIRGSLRRGSQQKIAI